MKKWCLADIFIMWSQAEFISKNNTQIFNSFSWIDIITIGGDVVYILFFTMNQNQLFSHVFKWLKLLTEKR